MITKNVLENNRVREVTLKTLFKKEIIIMGKVISKVIKFAASPSPDVVNNRLYYSTEQGLNYDSDFVEVGNETDVDGNVVVDLGSFLTVEGDYYIGVAAVDDVGNEADIVEYPNAIPLDFQIPEPVGELILL